MGKLSKSQIRKTILSLKTNKELKLLLNRGLITKKEYNIHYENM